MNSRTTSLLVFLAMKGLVICSGAWADNACQGVDLRRPDLNRPQSQVFMNADGKETDSGLCASFSSALLTSQLLGTAINPVDYVFQNTLAMLSGSDNNVGYCTQKAVDVYLGNTQGNFIQAFSDFVHQVDASVNVNPNGIAGMSDGEKQKIGQWLSGVCGQRIQSPSLNFTTKDFTPGDSSAGDQIDRVLGAGHFVSYTYAYHTVTIVGKTEDCRYIIQDSISESAWNTFGGLPVNAQTDQAQITFENQFFQYWPSAILLKNIERIWYAETPAR